MVVVRRRSPAGGEGEKDEEEGKPAEKGRRRYGRAETGRNGGKIKETRVERRGREVSYTRDENASARWSSRRLNNFCTSGLFLHFFPFVTFKSQI